MDSSPTSTGIRYSAQSRHRITAVLVLVAFIVSVILLLPLDPRMPMPGLDPSWSYALNEAVAHHRVFGRDVIFTFGPLASVYTHVYHPSTDRIMLVGASVVALGFTSGFALIAFSRRPLALWLLPVVILITDSVDAIFMVLPLCLLLASLLLEGKNAAPNSIKVSPGTLIKFALLACAIGLMPLVKGSSAGVAGALAAISLVILVRGGHARLAACLALVAIVSMIAGWTLTGQPLSALPDYFLGQSQLISGYSEAMASDGPRKIVIRWAIPSALLLATFYWSIARKRRLNGLLATAGVAAFLFVSFKAGFVRQDQHPLNTIDSLLFAGLAVAMLLERRQAIVIGCIVFAGWCAIERSLLDLNATALRHRVTMRMTAPVTGWKKRKRGALESEFAAANEAIRRHYDQAPVAGSVDVYPNELAVIFANHLPWAGRPVFQSYAAYTPTLDEVNARHLLGHHAPHEILFDVAPIDNRLPTLEDASSWPILLTSYSVSRQNSAFLALERNPVAHAPAITALATIAASVNEPVDVPQAAGPVMVRIDMAPSLRGKARTFVLRPDPVYIELVLSDGRVVRHRYIPRMGEADFIVSPYIASRSDFMKLAAGIPPNAVRQLKIVANPEQWRPAIKLSFSTFTLKPQQSARELLSEAPATAPPEIVNKTAGTAQCSLDSINGSLVPPKAALFPASGPILTVTGWAAPSASSGIAPDAIWIKTSAENERPRFYRAQLQSRPDVGSAFGHPELGPVGFTVNIDMAALKRKQNMSIYALRGGTSYDCGIVQSIAPHYDDAAHDR